MLDRFDRLYKDCEKCKYGIYRELGIMDDIRNLVTCNTCGHKAKRHREEDNETS